MSHVLVVGGGIAGLWTAVKAADAGHDVELVTKTELVESNTAYAQGGIAAALFPDDSADRHFADTIEAGAGQADPAAVRVLCDEGPARVRDLIRFGVEFDRGESGLERGLEAAHSRPRILHAGGDGTGAAIEAALVATVRRRAVRIAERTMLVDLVVEGGAVVGARVLDEHGAVVERRADAVVLATGGSGCLYRHTTNPSVATGDGVAAAWRAGARVADLEFTQFHPTALAAPGTPLLSEAVRGEGAVLRDRDGRRFMLDVHPDAELAPRDVVARAVWRQMAAQGGERRTARRHGARRRVPRPNVSRGSTPWCAQPGSTGPRTGADHARGALRHGRDRHRPPRPHEHDRPLRRRRGRPHGRSRRQSARLELAARGRRLRGARRPRPHHVSCPCPGAHPDPACRIRGSGPTRRPPTRRCRRVGSIR